MPYSKVYLTRFMTDNFSNTNLHLSLLSDSAFFIFFQTNVYKPEKFSLLAIKKLRISA